MNETPVQKAVTYVKGLLDDSSGMAESPLDDVASNLGSENYQEIDPYEVLEQAMKELGYDEATQQSVLDAAHQSPAGQYPVEDGGYSLDHLATIFAEGINITLEEGDYINVDNSQYISGDVHGSVYNENITDIVNADDGAVVAGGDQHGQFQTGDGVQTGDNYGLVNQGDNSGQQAGGDAYADNVTSGDGNTVASGSAIIGNENVQADYIQASEFGKGDQAINEDSYNTQSLTETTNDSYNTEKSEEKGYGHEEDHGYGEVKETDYGHQEDHGYEPVKEVYDEKDDHHEEPMEEEVYDS